MNKAVRGGGKGDDKAAAKNGVVVNVNLGDLPKYDWGKSSSSSSKPTADSDKKRKADDDEVVIQPKNKHPGGRPKDHSRLMRNLPKELKRSRPPLPRSRNCF